MPVVAREDGAEIAWYEAGSGPAVLLIMGLSYPAAAWYRQVPALAARYRVLSLDNRGSGRTGLVVGAPYTVETMAADCLAVLDAAGERRAHVIGISMGGLMAQELALSHPERVRSLALIATHPGAADGVWPAEVGAFLASRVGMSASESAEASIPFNYAAATSRTLIEEDWANRLDGTAAAEGYAAQGGTAYWAGLARLPEISVPTLVMYGEQDRLVVPANSEKLAAAIPGAALVGVPNANHLLTTDQTDEVNARILAWLDDQP